MTFIRQSNFPSLVAATLLGFGWLASCNLYSNELRAADEQETLASADRVDFNRDVRPILANNCFQCHGPDEGTREADLRLDTLAGAIIDLDGHSAIVVGKPAQSMLVERIKSTDPDERMPPLESGKKLSAAEIKILETWIAEGANYAKHWSLEPIKRTIPPTTKANDWVENEIDAFILAQLEKKKIRPSNAARKETLVRRLYLDLLGIPPKPREVDKFVYDDRVGAFDRMLDRIFASPHYGERWGRHWLDQARYADSHGYTNDNERVMWPYRDWVIDAFNRDLPFDEFSTEQLAGDLLDSPSLAQIVATGFHRNTLINSEGGTKADQFHDEQTKDRVDTTGVVWLGLTVGCAKCHAHKYDPISQKEYYQLYAFFNSTVDKNSVAPTVQVPSQIQVAKQNLLDAAIKELTAKIAADNSREQRQLAWEKRVVQLADQANSTTKQQDKMWTTPDPDPKSKHGAIFETLDDKSVLVKGTDKAADEYKVTLRSPLTKIRSVRIEAIKHDSLPMGGPGRAGNGNFVLSEIWFRTGDGRELRFNKAFADHSQPKYSVDKSIDNNDGTGWAINGTPEGGANHNRVAWFVLPTVLEVEENHALTFTMQFNNGTAAYNMGRFRISISSDEYIDNPSTSDLAKLARIESGDRSDSQAKRLDDAFVKQDAVLGPIFSNLESSKKQRETVGRSVPSTMVIRELPKPLDNYIHVRGDFLRHGEAVSATIPQALPALPESESRQTRLEFAKWLTRGDNPLTARVRVNRIWMRLFGRGLVATENDFGTQGTLPTHPDLLDWLSSEYIESGWSTKRLIRTIVQSATYRQASNLRPDLEASDPSNLWLARQNRIRVEAEIVRDIALAASGELSHKIGGKSVFPPQSDGVYAFTQRKKSWRTSTGEDRYRRGMYTFFYRSAPHPMLTTFDVPKFNTTCTRRDRSNTPLQSLTVANSESMFELAGKLASVIQSESKDDADRIRNMFRRCFSRVPSANESDVVSKYLNKVRSLKIHKEEAANEHFAWTATARVIMNLDEFITRE
jgi:mono/diheme cytochrome c family protein